MTAASLRGGLSFGTGFPNIAPTLAKESSMDDDAANGMDDYSDGL